ncbi:MAG: hypothetical protein J0J00_10810 [Microbacterium sp.]|nr:hypothetical protein [Microbacterium sp.]
MSTKHSSTVILRSSLIWSGLVLAALAVVGALIGFLVAGPSGLVSALIGILMAGVFFALTAVTMLIGTRMAGETLFSTGYFALVLGGWFVKVIIFVVVMLVLRGQPWISPLVFFFSALAATIASLLIDIVVFARARVPFVGDVALPTSAEDPGEPRPGS